MIKILGIFLIFLSYYSLEGGGFEWGLVQTFLVGTFFYFSEALFTHFTFVAREKTRARYRRRR